MKLQHFMNSRSWQGAGLLLIDGVFFGVTDPLRLPAYMLLISVMLFAVTVYWLLSGLLKVGKWYGIRAGRERRLPATAAGLLAGVTALQSIGQLSSRDMLVLVPLAVLAYFYASYLRADRGT